MDKTAADTHLARLARAERAHHRTQDTLRRTINRLETRIAEQTRHARDIELAIARRQDTRGDAFTMTVEGRAYRKRADAGRHLLHRISQEAANHLGYRQRDLDTGELGGFPLTARISSALDDVHVTMTFDGAPGTDLALTPADLADLDPVGLVTRLENRLARLEATKSQVHADIDHARSEIDHATASLGKPFPQAAELSAARERVKQIDEQLEAAAAPPRPLEPQQEIIADQRAAISAQRDPASQRFADTRSPAPYSVSPVTREAEEREPGL